MSRDCAVCTFHYSEPPKPFKVNDLCVHHRKLVEALKPMLKTCAKVARLAVDNDEVCYLAEAFTQELTSSAHRYPRFKWLDPNVLQADVDKSLRLLLLDLRSLTTTAV